MFLSLYSHFLDSYHSGLWGDSVVMGVFTDRNTSERLVFNALMILTHYSPV